ncbi:MAG: c-type cytochrome [Ignavibacteriaceae bacterium]|jgi:cytochrome c|nr:c-type cytochrome [Ignavibacteriaceae bacterium]
MEFLDKLVLPQSAEHIGLLHYILTLVLALFVPFISVVFGGAFSSIYFLKRFKKTKNLFYLKFSKQLIEYLTVNPAAGIILGLVPLLTAILVLTQLLHTSRIQTVGFLVLSFVFVSTALVLIYAYRNLMVSIKINDSDNTKDENRISESNSFYLKSNYGKIGLIFLFAGIWFYVAAITSVTNFLTWSFPGVITSIAAPKVLLNLLFFLVFVFALSNAAFLFVHLYWKKVKQKDDSDYTKFVTGICSKSGLRASILLPVFIAINLFSFSETALSGAIFMYPVISILLIFLAYHLFYMILNKNEYKFGSLIFFILIFGWIALIIKDQKAMTNATENHSLVLSTDYDRMLAELKGEGTAAVLNGKEIYDVRCASCHKFDQKFVGPAHFDVLPKYEGKEAQLIAFIRNPVKIDPAYPPMPNPGLTPKEVDAVVKYVLEKYNEQKK